MSYNGYKGIHVKKKLIITLVLLALFAAAVGGGAWLLFTHYQDDPGFLEKTTLNGTAIGGQTPEEVADRYAAAYNTEKTQVVLSEKGETALEGSLDTFGYSCDRDSFEELLKRAYTDQRSTLPALLDNLINGTAITEKELYHFDAAAFDKTVQSSRFAEPRVETVDPALDFDEATDRYVVTVGVEGNMIDDDALREVVRTQLDGFVSRGNLPEIITVEVPEEVYTSKLPRANLPELEEERDTKNREYRYQQTAGAYDQCQVTYVFGNEKEVLDHDTIMSWLTITEVPAEQAAAQTDGAEGESDATADAANQGESDGTADTADSEELTYEADDQPDYHFAVTLDEEALKAYVTSLKARYDTQYLKRDFTTTTGKTITFPEGQNEYGYRINYAEECAQLKADIEAKAPVEREPVYVKTNDYGNPLYYKRNGKDDLCGTYVEVNLTRQHLWFYIDGKLIVESDLVSGTVDKGRETQTGVFPLAYKQSPRLLTGDEAGGSGSWSVNVKYWMPFYDGEGLHDASWRGSFGGNIYVHSGSHGCVNLPPSAAEKIYNNIEVGMPIILYKE